MTAGSQAAGLIVRAGWGIVKVLPDDLASTPRASPHADVPRPHPIRPPRLPPRRSAVARRPRPAELGTARGSSFRPIADKSVVFLFLHGGPSQIETFDPKMAAPGRGPQRHRRGPDRPARRHLRRHRSRSSPSSADQLTIVRSFVTGDGNHDIKPVVGQRHLRRQPRLGLRPRRRARTIPTPACRPTSPCSRAPSIRRTQAGHDELRQLRRHRAVRRRPPPRSIPAAAARCRRT